MALSKMKTKWIEVLIIVMALGLLSFCFAAWDVTKPADSDPIYGWPASIRANNIAIEAILGAGLDGSGNIADIITKSPWVDVRAFGAVGNGVDDDTAAMQDAIDAIDDSEAKKLIIPNGTFLCSSTLNITGSNLTIEGLSHGSIIKSSANPAIRLIGSNNILKGFTIDDDSVAADSYCINGSAEGTTFSNNNQYIELILRGYDNGILLSSVDATYGCYWNQINRCYIDLDSRADTDGDGVTLDDSAGSAATTCIISNSIFRHCKICVNITDATPGTATSHVITDCEFTEAGTGLRINNCSYNRGSFRAEFLDDYYYNDEDTSGYNYFTVLGDATLLQDNTKRVLHDNSKLIQVSVTAVVPQLAEFGKYIEYACTFFSVRSQDQSETIFQVHGTDGKVILRPANGSEFGQNGVTRGLITSWDGAGGNTPGAIKIHSPDGTTWYLFVEDDGTVKINNALPTVNADGSAVGGQS